MIASTSPGRSINVFEGFRQGGKETPRVIEDSLYLPSTEDDGQMPALFGTDGAQFLIDVFTHNVAEEDCVESLVLSGRADPLLDRRMAQKILEIAAFEMLRTFSLTKRRKLLNHIR